MLVENLFKFISLLWITTVKRIDKNTHIRRKTQKYVKHNVK